MTDSAEHSSSIATTSLAASPREALLDAPTPVAASPNEPAPADPTAAEAASIDDDWQGDAVAPSVATRNRGLLLALAGSLALHLLPFATLVGIALLGAGSAPEKDPDRIGDEAGRPNGVNVELIDAKEYDRRYLSDTNGPATGNQNVAPAASQPAEKPPEPQPEPKPPQEQASQADKTPPAPDPEAPGGLTKAEAEALIRTAQSELQSVAEAASKASLAAQGTASPAIRAIIRKLKRAMPSSKNLHGNLVVRIVLTDTGGLQSVGLLRSSGNADLDSQVVNSVRNTLARNVSEHLKPNERLLQITYEYL